MTAQEKRLHYYQLGLNDVEIAKLQDVTFSAIRSWRQARGLAANQTPGGNRNPWGRKGKGKNYDWCE